MEQRTDQWFSARTGRITASRFGDVLAGKKTKRRMAYIEEVSDGIRGIPKFKENNPWFNHGNDWEPEARGDYAWRRMAAGDEITIKEVGIFIHKEYPFISCSPDHAILGDKGGKGGGEIKAHKSLDQHLAYIGKLPAVHKPQVQGCLWITEWDFWDFFSYYKDVASGKTHGSIFRVYPDKEYHTKLERACLRFYDDVLAHVRYKEILFREHLPERIKA